MGRSESINLNIRFNLYISTHTTCWDYFLTFVLHLPKTQAKSHYFDTWDQNLVMCGTVPRSHASLRGVDWR